MTGYDNADLPSGRRNEQQPSTSVEGLAVDDGLLGAAIVFIAIYLPRQVIVLTIHFSLLGRSQPPAVGSAIASDFASYGGFFPFQMGGFAGSQLAAVYALCNAFLLVLSALSDFAFRLGLRYGR